jgi:HEAT repeat protein
MEAIRSLARIGGREATNLLLDLLEDKNQSIRKQAIIWLGITRNEKSLEKLLKLVMKHDFSGKLHSIKKEAVIAIGRIGDRRALEPLCRLVGKRRLLSTDRWEELKIIAIEAIGRVGGEYSRAFLEKMEAGGGRIGKACSAALISLNHLEGNQATAVMEDSGEMEGGVVR